MATEITSAYVSLIVSAKGIGRDIGRELDREAGPAGERGGDQAGGRFSEGFRGAMTGMLAGAAGIMGIDLLMQSVMGEIDKAQMPKQLGAQFGLAGPEAEAAAKIAGDVYAKGWGESIGAVGSSVATLGRTLKNLGSNEDVGKLTVQAEALAATFGEDVGSVINAAEQQVRTGLAPTMSAAFDNITKGFQNGANSGQDFLDTLNEYSGQFQKLGLDGTVATGLLNQGLQAGARNSDLVADAIKEFSIRAVDGSKLSAQGFEALGLSATEMTNTFAAGGPGAATALDLVLERLRGIKDPALQSQTAVALFGTQAEDLGASLYALDPAAAATTGAMEGVEGAAQNLADTAGGGPKSALTEFGRVIQGELGNALQFVVPLLMGVFNVLRPFLPVLGPLAVAIGVLVAVQWAWNAALAANPIVLIILGVVALVAAVIWLWNNVDGFKQFFVDAWNWILGALQWVWNWIKENWPYLLILLTGPFILIVAAVVLFWDEISAAFTAAWNWIKNLFAASWRWIVNSFNTLKSLPIKIALWAKSMVDKAKEKLGKLIDFIKGLPGRVTRAAKGLFNGIRDSLKSALNWVIEKWNNFSLTIGGGSVLGVSIPSITIDTPNIPYLAKGGVQPRTPGGRLAVIGEGREPEAVQPLSHLRGMLDDAVTRGGQPIDYDRLAEALARAMPDVVLRINDTEVARANRSGEKRLTRRG